MKKFETQSATQIRVNNLEKSEHFWERFQIRNNHLIKSDWKNNLKRGNFYLKASKYRCSLEVSENCLGKLQLEHSGEENLDMREPNANRLYTSQEFIYKYGLKSIQETNNTKIVV